MDSEYYLYDQVLLGRKNSIGKELFEVPVSNKVEYNPQDEQRAIKIVRYVFEYYLGWNPEQIMANIDEQVLKDWGIAAMVKQRIRFPAELEPMDNLQYLVHLLYPDLYGYDKQQAVEAFYERLLSGEVKRFKKGFFKEENYGRFRATVCFRKMLQHCRPFTSVREMYDVFAGPEGRKILTRFKLYIALRDLDQYPIDFLHQSLPEECRDEFYYHWLLFNIVNNKQKRDMRAEKTFVA